MHILQVKMTDESALSLAIEGLIDMCQECLKTFIVLDYDKSKERQLAIGDAVENV